MEGITIPNIITTLAGTIIAPTTITFIIIGIIDGTIGGIGIDRSKAIRRKRCVATQLEAFPLLKTVFLRDSYQKYVAKSPPTPTWGS